MIYCAVCNDTTGPWIYIDGLGFVCENCTEKRKRYEKKIRKHTDKYKKERLKNEATSF